jgi:SRSO17 transposase
LSVHLSVFEHFFRNKTKVFFSKAESYTQGIVKTDMRNIERISENIRTNYFQMQHFISESNWDGQAVIDKVAQEVSKTLPKRKLTGLIIDESGWVKKGNKSVGVGHQYCGNVGKTANSQVAVFACLSNGDFASMVDARLYLPKDWCDNSSRCDEAKIPHQKRGFKTKLDLASEIIGHLIEQGISFEFISADGYYGNDASLARTIDRMGIIYMLDIHSDQTIYTERPQLEIPERKSTRGKNPQKLKPTTKGLSVKQYFETLADSDFKTLTVRNTVKGKLKSDYHFVKVYIWDKNINTIGPRLLQVRKTKLKDGTAEIKYSFTNANLEQYTPEALAYMQAQRFFVEHCIKESKQTLGIDEFQTRLWNAWEHQVALNFIVSSFMLKEKLTCFDEMPLLSARDIKEFLSFKLFKEMTEEQMLERIQKRHKIRQMDINRYYS